MLSPLEKLINQFHQAQDVGLVSEIVHQKSGAYPTLPTKTTIKFYSHIKHSIVDVLYNYLQEHYAVTDHIRHVTSVVVDGGERQIAFYSNWSNGA
jgi:hypothetical protein